MRKILTIFFSFFSGKKQNKDSAFENLMRRAAVLKKQANLVGLQDLQKIILKPIQAAHILDAYIKPAHSAMTELAWPEALGIECRVPSSNEWFSYHAMKYCSPSPEKHLKPLDLSTDIVLPTCWHPTSIVSTLGMIGSGLPAGIFTQDMNHRVIYVYPLGVGWVNNGNHSIAQGIIRGEGLFYEYGYVEIVDLMDLVHYDGIGWKVRGQSSYSGTPVYPEFGWAWEVGRMIAELENKL